VHNSAADPGPVTPERRAAARAAISAAPDAVVVAFAGRLVAQKNPELFIEAAAIAAPARHDLRFVLFGDGPARSALEDLARARGVAERVKFLGHRPDAIDLYAGVDVMAFTSRYEGLPFAVLEAMALGVPVVAVRIPGMDEAVVDGGTGRLIDGGARELADAITRLAADPAARASMGLAARARALERFSVQRMVDETTAVYARISTRD
jgi:glycosyltransferase involved in cell wall biosynthesis